MASTLVQEPSQQDLQKATVHPIVQVTCHHPGGPCVQVAPIMQGPCRAPWLTPPPPQGPECPPWWMPHDHAKTGVWENVTVLCLGSEPTRAHTGGLLHGVKEALQESGWVCGRQLPP